jgi:methylthioribulose-1-phosphate dehydratase
MLVRIQPGPAGEPSALVCDHGRELLSEFLRLFYARNWVSGTGGGICAVTPDGRLLLAPSGVHKERVQPDDFFTIDMRTGAIVTRPADTRLQPSACAPIFRSIIHRRGAGAVMHSHALSAVLAADLAIDGQVSFACLEMLKGIRGVSNQDRHLVPVIGNTPEEPDLTQEVELVLGQERFGRSACILVRDHGAYIWGTDLWEAKRHAEVYHFLFEAARARHT